MGRLDGRNRGGAIRDMADDRCFRIDERDLEELRDHFRDQELVDSFSHWIRDEAETSKKRCELSQRIKSDHNCPDTSSEWESPILAMTSSGD